MELVQQRQAAGRQVSDTCLPAGRQRKIRKVQKPVTKKYNLNNMLSHDKKLF